MKPIQIFYDGLDIQKWANKSFVKGFTTNCCFFSQHSLRNYKQFYQSVKDSVAGRPISFQVWEEEDRLIEQIQQIHSIDPSIYVKVPIIKRDGTYNTKALEYIAENSIPVNVTAVYTLDHIDTAFDCLLNSKSPIILSVFAGPISDGGTDPTQFVLYAKNCFRHMPNVQILWAGCREAYTIYRAAEMGCDIITVPDGVIEKIEVSKTLNELAMERVTKFYTDAVKGDVSIL